MAASLVGEAGLYKQRTDGMTPGGGGSSQQVICRRLHSASEHTQQRLWDPFRLGQNRGDQSAELDINVRNLLVSFKEEDVKPYF